MAKRRINLALQGGGAHGAFTWGALDRLLEESELEIAAISGTSAGAVNGAALKAGLIHNDREAARENLAWLWDQMGALSGVPIESWFAGDFLPQAASSLIENSPLYQAAELTSRMLSPYASATALHNPLERVVAKFDYDKIRAHDGPAFFVSATNVRSGRVKVFRGAEVSKAAILASAALPTLFPAVEIRDPETGQMEAYWDGGYTANPALFPLYHAELPDDLVIVNINPLRRESVPVAPQDIQNRINEISFNASLMGELRSIEFVQRLIREGRIEKGAMKDVRLHMIADDPMMRDLSVATKLVPNPAILQRLRRAGYEAADKFLAENLAAIGAHSTLTQAQL